jgi:two-component system, NtrC family, nitrogen regulation response regulator NtrX
MVAAGKFREDLYYRLRVVPLLIPPLSERREDIPLLIDQFLRESATRFGRPVKPLTGEALRAAMQHPWKGNVRELRSAIEQALLLSSGPEIETGDILGAGAQRVHDEPLLGRSVGAADNGVGSADLPRSFREAKDQVVEAFERDFLLQALRRNDGNITRAAEEIGMYRQNLQQKIRELGITNEEINLGTGPDEA